MKALKYILKYLSIFIYFDEANILSYWSHWLLHRPYLKDVAKI